MKLSCNWCNKILRRKTKVLVDAMYDGLDKKLQEHGFEAYSVKKLIENERKPLKSDYSVLTYAKKNHMILVTRDGENRIGCEENNIPHVIVGENPTVEEVIEKIKTRLNLLL